MWSCSIFAESCVMKYKDPTQPLNVRIKDLLGRMTLEEKIGQMTQIDRSVATPDVMRNYFIGSLLSGGGSVPAKEASPETWVNMVNDFQKGALSSRLGIPMIYGIDAVHGHSNVYNATIFPHNVGLGVTRDVGDSNGFHSSLLDLHSSLYLRCCTEDLLSYCDILQWLIEIYSRTPNPGTKSKEKYELVLDDFGDSELVKKIGAATALEVRATGIHYTFAPCVAVCRDPRWGRCFESYSEDPNIVRQMTEIIPGLQGDIPINGRKGVPFVDGQTKVAASAKHFVGDGGTTRGINENDTVTDFHGLLSIHMPPYYDAGFVISDFQGIDKITDPPHANYTLSVQEGINAGIDMVMVGYNYFEFIDTLTYLVNNNFIPMSRIDDAVKRILRVKFVMGLFENPLSDFSMVKYLGEQAHRDLAREAARKSLVLLKNGKCVNEPMLPLPKKSTKILVAGTHADNIGYQCGGWTIEWHGGSGNITKGTTILSAVKNVVDPSTEVVYAENPTPEFIRSNNFSYAIVVTGEHPYSESYGDSQNLTIPEPGPTTIMNVCESVKCVVVLVSGRPVVIEPYVSSMDALVAAWLPGTEGQGVTDVLFGDYGFSGKLARTWFRTVDQLPMNVGDSHYDPLYPFGYGLATEPNKV
ncbi:hypothetical protein SSX86_018666 [Deinandra increscens subsp. villosa]|uniref:Beta-glucosidase n=1 Tax=Deinandra increscens subsp. villosa TaxID=3103831 RepID=A0AAP0GWI5_9ASTR